MAQIGKSLPPKPRPDFSHFPPSLLCHYNPNLPPLSRTTSPPSSLSSSPSLHSNPSSSLSSSPSLQPAPNPVSSHPVSSHPVSSHPSSSTAQIIHLENHSTQGLLPPASSSPPSSLPPSSLSPASPPSSLPPSSLPPPSHNLSTHNIIHLENHPLQPPKSSPSSLPPSPSSHNVIHLKSPPSSIATPSTSSVPTSSIPLALSSTPKTSPSTPPSTSPPSSTSRPSSTSPPSSTSRPSSTSPHLLPLPEATEYDRYVFGTLPFWGGDICTQNGKIVSVKCHTIGKSADVDLSQIKWVPNFEISKARSINKPSRTKKNEIMEVEIFPLDGYMGAYLDLMDACEKNILVARIPNYEIEFTPPSKNSFFYPNCREGKYLRAKCYERPLKDMKFTLLCTPEQEYMAIEKLRNKGATYVKFVESLDPTKINSVIIHESMKLENVPKFSMLLIHDHLKFYTFTNKISLMSEIFPQGSGLIVLDPSFSLTKDIIPAMDKIMNYFHKPQKFKLFVPKQTLSTYGPEIRETLGAFPQYSMPPDPRQPMQGDAQKIATDLQSRHKTSFRYFFVAKGPPEISLNSLYCLTSLEWIQQWLDWHKKVNTPVAPPPVQPPPPSSNPNNPPGSEISRRMQQLNEKPKESRHICIIGVRESEEQLLPKLKRCGPVQRLRVLGNLAHVTFRDVSNAKNFIAQYSNKSGVKMQIKYENPQFGEPSNSLTIFNIGPETKTGDLEIVLRAHGELAKKASGKECFDWDVPKKDIHGQALRVTYVETKSAISFFFSFFFLLFFLFMEWDFLHVTSNRFFENYPGHFLRVIYVDTNSGLFFFSPFFCFFYISHSSNINNGHRNNDSRNVHNNHETNERYFNRNNSENNFDRNDNFTSNSDFSNNFQNSNNNNANNNFTNNTNFRSNLPNTNFQNNNDNNFRYFNNTNNYQNSTNFPNQNTQQNTSFNSNNPNHYSPNNNNHYNPNNNNPNNNNSNNNSSIVRNPAKNNTSNNNNFNNNNTNNTNYNANTEKRKRDQQRANAPEEEEEEEFLVDNRKRKK
eukprot:Phypoly_transcript_00569.p1 GENE.Phypoly_transcript_00569~~Phypoly_transcript_00569.p1  ORF type:complete len:1035 (-),score=231.65 Phypoly_transcript_00569:40-3144(-)